MAFSAAGKIARGLKAKLTGSPEAGANLTVVLPSWNDFSQEPSNAKSTFTDLAKRAAAGELSDSIHATEGIDAQSYKARAAAHGKEISLADEGMNTAVDGEEFWGPFDNNSARSKACGRVLTVDQDECISCGTCEENSSTVFHLTDDKADVLAQDGPMDLIQEAIDACPVMCINWIPSVYFI
jgi:ferredoxin